MRKWILLAVPLGVLLGFLLVRQSLVPQRVAYFVLEPRDVFETLVAAGRAKFSKNLELAFEVPGIVKDIFVQEGEQVARGALLVTLEASLEENSVAQAKMELELAEIALRRLSTYERRLAEEELRRAEIEEKTAWDRYQRTQRLSASGSIPEEELERTRKEWEAALSLVKTARLNLESITESGIRFREAQARVEQARLQLSQAETNLAKKSLSAPLGGTIVDILKHAGEFVQPGETVMVLGENPLEILTRVDEREYKRIATGMRALVSEQADVEKRVFLASVQRIAPAVDPSQGTVEVILVLDGGQEANLKPEAAVNVEIILREERGVLAFPKRYLSFSGSATVWLEKDGKASSFPLSEFTAIGDWVVTRDLSRGTVLLNPRGLKEGKRITLGERRSD